MGENVKYAHDAEDAFYFANFNRWAARAYWTCDELAALSLGKDPRSLNLEKCCNRTGAIVFEFLDRLDTIRRACEVAQIQWKMQPNIGIEWLLKFQVPFDPQLATEVDRFYKVLDWRNAFLGLWHDSSERVSELNEQIEHYRIALDDIAEQQAVSAALEQAAISRIASLIAQKAEMAERLSSIEGQRVLTSNDVAEAACNDNEPGEPIDRRRYNSALRMIYGMARAKFHLDSGGPAEAGAAAKIESALAQSGVSLSLKTVRSLLVEALNYHRASEK